MNETDHLAAADTPAEIEIDFLKHKIPGVGHAIVFMLTFLGVAGTISMTGAIIALIAGGAPPDLFGQSPLLVWLTSLGNTVAVAVVLMIGAAWSKRPWSEIVPLVKFNPLLLVSLLLAAVGLSILMSDADNLLRWLLPAPEWLMEMMLGLAQSGLASFVVLVVVAPLTEEALFRGLMMNGFLSRFSPGKAIVVNAVLFSVFHLNPYQMANAFVLGLLLAWLRVRTGSLLPCILLHAMANGVAFVAALLPIEIPGYTVADPWSMQPWWLDVLGLVFAAGGLLLTYALLRERGGKAAKTGA
jgi:membrane protease YdiL (CAAX protease family)